MFPADTVYGLACEPDTREAVERLYALKGRSPDKPSAIMFFDLELAFAALPELGPHAHAAVAADARRLTALLPNPLRRYPLACGAGGGDVPRSACACPRSARTPGAAAMRWPVHAELGQPLRRPDAHRLDDVPEEIRRGADLVLDGGELAGTPRPWSTCGASSSTANGR